MRAPFVSVKRANRRSAVTVRADTDVVTAVGFDASNDLISCGDDKQILRWNHAGEVRAGWFGGCERGLRFWCTGV